MFYKNSNNEFFGWQGCISRKNYAINMAIVFVLYIVLSLVNFSAFEPFIPIKFLITAMVYMAELLKLVLVMCALSLIFRRIADFSGTKPYGFQLVMKRIFIFLYVVPTLYLLCIRYFFSILPVFNQIMDFIVFLILIPIAFICAIIFCFIKGFN